MKINYSLLQDIFRGLPVQFNKLGRIILISHFILLILFAGIAILGSQLSIDYGMITRDPNQLGRLHPLAGILSNVGILLWCTVAVLCFFVFSITRNRIEKKLGRFLLSSAYLTLYLLLDDLLLIHEMIGPQYLHVHDRIFYLVYFVILLGYLLYFSRLILSTEYLLLILSFVYFGVSVFIDVIPDIMDVHTQTLIEDALKFLGIISWLLYFLRICLTTAKKLNQTAL